MEEYATNDDLQTRLPLEKIEKINEAKERVKRRMAQFTRAPEELHGTTNKLGN